MDIMESQRIAEEIDGYYIDLESQIMQNIAKHLSDWGQPIASDEWQIRRLAEIGKLDQEHIAMIAKMSGISQTAAIRMLNDTAEKSIKTIDRGLQKAARDGLVGIPVVPKKSRAVKEVMQAYRMQAKDALNTCCTVMLYKARAAYVGLVNDITNEAHAILSSSATSVVSGVESRQQAVVKCIRKFCEKGIPAFVDKAGREWTPEAYVNMCMRNTAKRVADEAQDARCREAGVNLILIDSHSGARPKCAKDQGKVFDLNNGSGYTHDLHGKKIRYYPWSSSSYGEPDGILGINCRHHKWPFVPGVSVQRYFPTEDMAENDRLYKQTQVQRALERDVRKQKRLCMMYDASGNEEAFEEAAVKLKGAEKKLKGYVSNTPGLHRRSDRERVVGFDKRISANAVVANKKQGGEKHRIHISERSQAYRLVTRGESEQMTVGRKNVITVSRVTSYSEDVYISEKAKIKPKALYIINKTTKAAMKQWGIPLERKPKVVIATIKEVGVPGLYDAVTNTVFYVPEILKEKVAGKVGDIEFHEMWHLKQAENFRKRNGEITVENRGAYIKNASEEAKKKLDQLGINEYNVIKLGEYARNNYMVERFDEVEAEYMTLRREGR